MDGGSVKLLVFEGVPLNVLFFLSLSEKVIFVVVKVPMVPSNVGDNKASGLFYFLECMSPLIGFINIYTLSTNRNKYNTHCRRMSTFSIYGEMNL